MSTKHTRSSIFSPLLLSFLLCASVPDITSLLRRFLSKLVMSVCVWEGGGQCKAKDLTLHSYSFTVFAKKAALPTLRPRGPLTQCILDGWKEGSLRRQDWSPGMYRLYGHRQNDGPATTQSNFLILQMRSQSPERPRSVSDSQSKPGTGTQGL